MRFRTRPRPQNYRRAGLSLTELLITLGIVSLLAAITLPGFGAMLDRVRVITLVAQFQEAISLARAEALRRRTRVDLIPLRDANWASGWQVLIDADNDHLAGAEDTVLHRGPIPPPGLRIDARLRDPKAYLAFDASGRPRSAASSAVPQIGSLLFVAGHEQRKLIISFLGRVRICDPVRDKTAC
jgi:type IV fimbrial biogenesis protein FimT